MHFKNTSRICRSASASAVGSSVGRWKSRLLWITVGALISAAFTWLAASGLPTRAVHAIRASFESEPPPPPVEEVIVSKYATQTRTATFWAEPPVMFAPSWQEWFDGARAGTIVNRNEQPYKPSVLRGYEQAMGVYVLPELGAHRLTDIRRADVQRLVNELHARELNVSTIRNAVNPLRALYRHALENDRVAVNPTVGLTRVKVRRAEHRRELEPERADLSAVEMFLGALPADLRPLYITAFDGGLRRGELRALRWQNVDLANGVIRVEASMDDQAGLIAPKSHAGKREVTLTARLRDVLTEHKQRTRGKPDAFVFGSKNGGPFTPSNIGKRVRRIARQKDVPNYTLHELRHARVSFDLDAGLTLEQIAPEIGHSADGMVAQYGHKVKGAQERVRARRDAYFAQHAAGTKIGTHALQALETNQRE